MFIRRSQGGYNRQGEQFCRGSFLMIFAHNEHRWEEQHNTPHVDLHGQTFATVNGDGFEIQQTCTCRGQAPYTYALGEPVPSYYLKYCKAHSHEYKTMPEELNRKLYGCVRHVSLRQFGQFMMGSARIAGQSVTVSGTYGSDGLPMDYEKLNERARAMLVELPADVTETFWKGDGWNSAGSEGPDVQRWALQTFKAK